MPLLKRQLHTLAEHGFTHVLMLVNYRADAIEEFCASNDIAGIQVDVVQDSGGARGTAGAVWDAAHLLHDRFLVVYGDTLFDVNLDRFWKAHVRAHEERRIQGSLFLHPNDHPHDSDLVEMDEVGMIRAFHPKPHAENAFHRNMVNAALYVLDKSILSALQLEDGIVDFGKDLFPRALSAGIALQGYATFEYIKDIGTPDRLDRAVADLRSGKIARSRLDTPQRAVFLDRDGTLNIPNGHIATPEALTLIDGVGEAVARLNRAEYRCVLITNQPVLARGEVTLEGLEAIHAKLETELGRGAAFLDGSYVCPHYPESGFPGEVPELKVVCDCRKPAPGLLQRAIADLSIDPAQSWMIGDSEADVGAARAVGVSSILVRTGGTDSANFSFGPDVEVENLAAAVDFILNHDAISSKSMTSS
ncbi:histidinol phosphate phosphatase [Sphingobium sp. TomTYG75]